MKDDIKEKFFTLTRVTMPIVDIDNIWDDDVIVERVEFGDVERIENKFQFTVTHNKEKTKANCMLRFKNESVYIGEVEGSNVDVRMKANFYIKENLTEKEFDIVISRHTFMMMYTYLRATVFYSTVNLPKPILLPVANISSDKLDVETFETILPIEEFKDFNVGEVSPCSEEYYN